MATKCTNSLVPLYTTGDVVFLRDSCRLDRHFQSLPVTTSKLQSADFEARHLEKKHNMEVSLLYPLFPECQGLTKDWTVKPQIRQALDSASDPPPLAAAAASRPPGAGPRSTASSSHGWVRLGVIFAQTADQMRQTVPAMFSWLPYKKAVYVGRNPSPSWEVLWAAFYIIRCATS